MASPFVPILVPPLHRFPLRELVLRQSVSYESWQPWFERYLNELLDLNEEEPDSPIPADIPDHVLTEAEFFLLLSAAARLGAVATLAAIDALRPSEPPV